jgi:hypothetical protein
MGGCEFITQISIIQNDLSFILQRLQFPHCPVFFFLRPSIIHNSSPLKLYVLIVRTNVSLMDNHLYSVPESEVQNNCTHMPMQGVQKIRSIKRHDVRCIMTQVKSYSKRTSINTLFKVYDFVCRRFRKIAKIHYKLRHISVHVPVRPSIRMKQLGYVWAILIKFEILFITVHSPTNALFIKLGMFKIYIRIHKYRSYMFRSSTIVRELVLSLAKLMLEHLCPYRLCGGVAACLQ